jgi:hypothetical protein
MSTDVMATMRNVLVCETMDPNSRAPGNLNVLGTPANPDGTGACNEIQPGTVPMLRKPHKRKTNACEPGQDANVCKPRMTLTPVDMSRRASEARRSRLR